MADPPSGPQAVADQSSAKKKQVGGCAKLVYIHFVYTHSFFTWLPYFCSPFINLTPVLLATIPTNANHWSFSIFCTECIAEGCEKRWALRWAAVPNSWSCHQVLHSSEQSLHHLYTCLARSHGSKKALLLLSMYCICISKQPFPRFCNDYEISLFSEIFFPVSRRNPVIETTGPVFELKLNITDSEVS